MLAKSPADRPDASAVYEALLPLARSAGTPVDDDDPRRPFVRPVAPRSSRRLARPAPAVPSTADEAIDVIERVEALANDDRMIHAAISLLDTAAARPTGNPRIDREVKVRLGALLSVAEEYTRAAAVLDEVIPQLDSDDPAAELRYQAASATPRAATPRPPFAT